MGGDGRLTGVRGGRDQFNWETVKSDKDREFYLGASVKATVGRWQANRDILWYTRDGAAGGPSAAAAAAAEAAAVRVEEQRAMDEALGLRPATDRAARTTLDAAALKALLARDPAAAAGAGGGAGGGGGEADRIKGVGFRSWADAPRPADAGFAPAERMPGVGGAGAEGVAAAGGAKRGLAPGDGAGGRGGRGDDDAAAAKRARREAREERREHKAARRERRAARHGGDEDHTRDDHRHRKA